MQSQKELKATRQAEGAALIFLFGAAMHSNSYLITHDPQQLLTIRLTEWSKVAEGRG